MRPDPYNPAVNLDDYIALQTMEFGSDTVTYASGAASSPSKPRVSFELPKVGIAHRILLDCEAAYDLTIGAGAAAVQSEGRGPWSLIERITLTVNGGATWANISGFGLYLMNAKDQGQFPQDAPGTVYTTAPTDIASTLFNYPVAADGTAKFGLEIPVSLPPDYFGMLLLHNDQTTVVLTITPGTLDDYAALTAGAVATLSLTITAVLEYIDVPSDPAIFMSYFVPVMQWAHWYDEEEQVIAAQGAQSNFVKLDNHDLLLTIAHAVILNGVLNTDNIDSVRLQLNRNVDKFSHPMAVQLRRQRDEMGKDLPAVIYNLYQDRNLRNTIDADAYTELRSFLAISGAVLGTSPRIITVTEKLVDLGPVNVS